ncbi:unnamed protein product [Tilletia caries]|uniref:Zinc-ribbon 15 domain-containing protein n=3 Tax=Tilletia TaxID=13289 RepID=A0A8X7SZM7_9BASI|nr:hypothetical protein CF336_g1096 [Tilletia laevis]KAE8205513.1 hypothetical protein CF328_g460 [Tilletia controversa]KAE8265435.1 hypothetical protein A4X03_0g269 [Tilletia caries]KAE8208162.1 hypothetical protein CF335_g618 [Tilletia laevis]KAE8253575.1 hypothetical protein A4X06_0g1351 [Tilletia controversa]
MDIFFCIPILFGCPTKIKQEDGSPHVCPRCHNGAVVKAKSRMWFELCCIPLIPIKTKHIYVCGICQWQAPQDGGFQPAPAGGYAGHPNQPQQYGYGPPQGYPPK